MTEYETEFEYSPQLAAEVYLELLWRMHAVYIICSVVIAGLAIYGLLANSYRVFWALWLGFIVALWYGWFQGARVARYAVAHLHSPTIQLKLNEDGCLIASSEGSIWFKWESVWRLYRLRSAIVLLRHSGVSSSPIPLSGLTSEAIELIEGLARAAGAQVI